MKRVQYSLELKILGSMHIYHIIIWTTGQLELLMQGQEKAILDENETAEDPDVPAADRGMVNVQRRPNSSYIFSVYILHYCLFHVQLSLADFNILCSSFWSNWSMVTSLFSSKTIKLQISIKSIVCLGYCMFCFHYKYWMHSFQLQVLYAQFSFISIVCKYVWYGHM